MKSSSIIFFNTLITYTRSIIGAALAIFSSRWVLESLGASDFGLYNLVGAIIIFITFLNSVMSGSSSRHFSYEIGKGNLSEVNKWFNTSLSIHILIPFILIIIGLPIGEYCIHNIFTIDPQRINIAIWVFRMSLVSALISMLSVPFIAMFIAKQKIYEMALIGIFQSIIVFFLTYILLYIKGDKLLFYSIFMTTATILIQLIQIFRAYFLFPECKINKSYWFEKMRFKKILSFASWTLIGNAGGLLRNQGITILLNMYFGTKVNAAYGISNQITTQAGAFSQAMMSSMSPEIVASEGRGDRKRVIQLSLQTSKYLTLLVLFFSIPLLVEMDYILKLWLKNPPQYTSVLCRLMLLMFIIDKCTDGQMMAVNASGRIAKYQSTVGIALVSTLPIAWLFLFLGFDPPSVAYACILTMLVCGFGRIYWAKVLVGIQFFDWVKDVFVPSFLIGLLSLIPAYFLISYYQESILRLFYVVGSSCTVFIASTIIIGLNKKEKEFFYNIIKKRI